MSASNKPGDDPLWPKDWETGLVVMVVVAAVLTIFIVVAYDRFRRVRHAREYPSLCHSAETATAPPDALPSPEDASKKMLAPRSHAPFHPGGDIELTEAPTVGESTTDRGLPPPPKLPPPASRSGLTVGANPRAASPIPVSSQI